MNTVLPQKAASKPKIFNCYATYSSPQSAYKQGCSLVRLLIRPISSVHNPFSMPNSQRFRLHSALTSSCQCSTPHDSHTLHHSFHSFRIRHKQQQPAFLQATTKIHRSNAGPRYMPIASSVFDKRTQCLIKKQQRQTQTIYLYAGKPKIAIQLGTTERKGLHTAANVVRVYLSSIVCAWCTTARSTAAKFTIRHRDHRQSRSLFAHTHIWRSALILGRSTIGFDFTLISTACPIHLQHLLFACSKIDRFGRGVFGISVQMLVNGIFCVVVALYFLPVTIEEILAAADNAKIIKYNYFIH
ncbi:unnamed protein product [Ceratitis capitata]|uniref:(Mediterranean fruit fly) hypothetical protein n=1 Tax=Ceratitis capitata TaxID=7213 RepID=A0A811VE69_CERCA|nr:unnamed protein product [Ceratitis capitata]